MYNLPNKTESSLSELLQQRKKKLKNKNNKKDNVTIEEWAYLEWPCVDDHTNKVSQ